MIGDRDGGLPGGGFPGYVVKDRRWWVQPEASEPEPAGAEGREPRPPQPAELEAQLAERDEQLRDARAREREAVQELDRARSRLERDARKEIERARRELAISLIPVLDDLDRAIAAARETAAPAALVTGVELVRSGFLEKLRRFGVERFEPAPGDAFDPNRHEAVSTLNAGDGNGRWVIMRTLAPGYAVAGETLRPAQVIVGRGEQRSLAW